MNRFGFVIHPLDITYIYDHPYFSWTRYLPPKLIERIGSIYPPVFLGKIQGVKSMETNEKIEGFLYSLGATPEMILSQPVWFMNKQLEFVAKLANKRGAKILGLGAFTSVVDDAGLTLSKHVDIAITTGNSLTVAVVIETSKRGLLAAGKKPWGDLKVMIVGATGAIGSACARYLAPQVKSLCLVGRKESKLLELKKDVEQISSDMDVEISIVSDVFISEADLIITTTSSTKNHIIDIMQCQSGTVVCDVAKPSNVSREEAKSRPEVLVIESGEVVVPGELVINYDIGNTTGTV